MSAKEAAVLDIKEDLKKQGKCFIAFRKDLNPVMRKLVREQIHAQNPFRKKHYGQLIAHCLFSYTTKEVKYDNYSKYYEQI